MSFHVAGLLGFRLTGLLWVAPVFSGRPVPSRVKVALLVLLVLLLLPVASDTATVGARLTPATVMGELVVGLTIGLGAAVMIAGAEAAGDVLAIQAGLSGASVVNPMSGSQLPTVGQFMGLIALTVLLAMNGHHLVLRSLADSLVVIPSGSTLRSGMGAFEMARLGGTLLRLGVQLAAPVIGALIMSNVALGVLARTVPQLNVLMVAFPVQIALGLLVLAASLPMIASTLAEWPAQFEVLVADLLGSGRTPVLGDP